MDKIPEKFPSIYNHPNYNEINIKLYNETPYRAIAEWLKEITQCEDDCISPSWIGNYARYVKQRGGFEQLIDPDDIDYENVTLMELDQHAMNLMYQRLPDLTDGNFVQAFGMILKYSRPTNLNVNADVKSEVTTNLLEKIKRKREELNGIDGD